MHPIKFLHPWLLLALVAAAPAIWISVYRAAGGRRRKRWLLAGRLLFAVCLVFALAGAQVRSAKAVRCRILVVDRSGSVAGGPSPAAGTTISRSGLDPAQLTPVMRCLLEDLDASDLAGVIVFGERPSVELSVGPVSDARARIGGITSTVSQDATDIAAALNLASRLFPPDAGKEIVLLSDGNETLGAAAREAEAAARKGIKVSAVPMWPQALRDVRVETLELPAHARLGEVFRARAKIRGTHSARVKVTLTRNGKPVAAPQELALLPGQLSVVQFRQQLEEEGVYSYAARVEADSDDCAKNNRREGIVHVKGPPTVLCISSDPDNCVPLELLAGSDFRVRAVRPEAVPQDLALLQSSDAVVVDNVPATAFAEAQMARLVSYVKDVGGGLLVCGGPESFGPGRYARTPLETVLPVWCDPKDRMSRQMALAIAIDRSGSMDERARGVRKIEFAQRAVLRALEELREQDQLSLIAFSDQPETALDLRPVKDKAAIRTAVRSLFPHGGTQVGPALEAAFSSLKGATLPVKHLILLSDGKSKPFDVERISAAMRDAQITVSVVATGGDVDRELLRTLAKNCNGRFHEVADVASLPDTFLAETRLASRSLIVEGEFSVRLGKASGPIGTLRSFPSIKGYTLAAAKETAETHLKLEDDDPLLATWQVGLGKVVAFTSSLDPAWGQAWLEWDGLPQLFRQCVRWCAKQIDDEGFVAEAQVEGGEIEIRATARRADQPVNLLALAADVVTPGGRRESVPLPQVAPGEYVGTLAGITEGSYLIAIFEARAEERVRRAELATVVSFSPEWMRFGPNRTLLERVAAVSGGTVIDPSRPLAASAGGQGARYTSIAWILALAALLLYLAELALS